MNPKTIFAAYQVARTGKKYYGLGMKIVDRIKSQVKLIVSIVMVYALVVLGLLVYIAIRVS